MRERHGPRAADLQADLGQVARVLCVEPLARHARGNNLSVGAHTHEQLAVLEHQQLLTRLGGNRRCAMPLHRPRTADHFKWLSTRAENLADTTV